MTCKDMERGDNWLICGARVADPLSELWGVRDVLVAGGRVVELASDMSSTRARRACDEPLRVLHAEGLWVWPGLVDLHVHFREPGFTHKETLAHACRAATHRRHTSRPCEHNHHTPTATP